VLSVSAVLLDFGTTNNILPIEISNTGKGELNWSIVEDLAWLSVNPTTGKTAATPASVTVSIDRSLFAETSKTGTFTVNSNGGSATVNVVAGKEVPVLNVSSTLLDFGISTNFLQLEISNTGKGELSWNIVEDLPWLSANPASGATTSTASVTTITIDRTLFTETSKTGSFVINSNGGNATVNVSAGKSVAVLNVSSTSLDFGTGANTLSLDIANTGTGELLWTILEDMEWLTVNPASGTIVTGQTSVALTVDRSKFTESSITGTVTVNSNGGSAIVNISAGQLNPVLNVSVTALDFSTTTNNLSFEITNTGKGELSWNIVEDLTWLSVNPASGKTTAATSVVTVTVNREQLAENSTTATFLVNSNVGSATINVSISKPQPFMNVTPATLDFGETETEKSINVSNTGAGTLSFTATAAQSWITLEGATGSVSTDIKVIKVKVSRGDLTSGNYNGSIVINSNANSVTAPVSMSVLQPAAPSLLNGQASSITYSSAQVSGTLTSLGSSAVTQHGHCWSASPNPTTANNKTALGGTSVLKSFASDITGLSANATYYVKAYATNAVGTTYSDAITFTTLPPPTVATVQTLSSANIKHNQIDGVGNLSVLGDGLVTDYGFCYSASSATPTVGDSKAGKGQTAQTGQFTVSVTNLQPSTKYYLRAYATNSIGTSYGTVIEATTLDAPPVVTSNLVAYYTFDYENCNETRGESLYDGVLQGTGEPIFSSDIPGNQGKALQLNKDVYYKMVTSPFAAISGAYTMNVWIKTTTSNFTLFRYENKGGDYKPCIAFKDGYVYTGFRYEATIFDAFNINVTNFLVDGGWHMLTVTRQSNSCNLYIDGKFYITAGNSSNWSGAWHFGEGYSGKVDNFRLYNRSLTQSEITEIYNSKQ
jgi:hypothetical protein